MGADTTIADLINTYWYVPFYLIIWVFWNTAKITVKYLKSINDNISKVHTVNEVQNERLDSHHEWIKSIEEDFKQCSKCENIMKWRESK